MPSENYLPEFLVQRYQFFLKLQNILAIISCERGSPTPFFCHLFSEVEKLNIAHFDLLPIPLSAIQANKDAELTQNPGY